MFDVSNQKEINTAEPKGIDFTVYNTGTSVVTDHAVFALVFAEKFVNINSHQKQVFD